MPSIRSTSTFDRWLSRLKDRRAAARIALRLLRAKDGNLAEVKPVGGGVSEMRIDCGPGYRVYFVQRGTVLIVLLCGGDKGSQAQDIEKAKRLAAELEE